MNAIIDYFCFSQPILKKFYLFIYLFIWLHRVLVAAHGIFMAVCGIFHCGARASLVAAHGILSSCGTRAQ